MTGVRRVPYRVMVADLRCATSTSVGDNKVTGKITPAEAEGKVSTWRRARHASRRHPADPPDLRQLGSLPRAEAHPGFRAVRVPPRPCPGLLSLRISKSTAPLEPGCCDDYENPGISARGTVSTRASLQVVQRDGVDAAP